ncbi:serine/threonine-protein kinase [Actinomadura terrae]|uniref:serine/threonine-protein kinase n=1 Tax=Actinomadura terrae TaxID=604353 RepID=UPI001FA72BA7|nr:serine/threonine-protein kinase [Actinomadura terrae]
MSEVIAARYELVEVLGRGGMGAVWRAHDRTLDREVAIKEVALPSGLDEAQVRRSYARTLREARSAARLDHPGIVTVYDVVEEDGRPWIVMQLVRAEALDAVIAREGPLPPRRVAAIGLDLLDALRAAHAAGVVHRDVKPGNVLLPGGRAVLTDFGIATLAGDETLTQAGAIVGSPAYLAPEQARHQKATPASDLWSLGGTLYAAVEGRPPYRRPDMWGLMAALLSDDPDPLERAGPLAPVLHGLLRRDPSERLRPDDAERLLRQVAETPSAPAPYAQYPPHPPRDATLPRPVPQPTLPPPGPLPQGTPPKRPARWALIVPAGVFSVALLAAVVAVVVFVNGGGGEGDDPGRGRASGGPRSGSAANGGTGGNTGGAPAGYEQFRGSEFVVAKPRGWTTDGSGDDVTFKDPSPSVIRGIAIQRPSLGLGHNTDPGDALATTANQFKNDSGSYPDYKQESFTRHIPYLGDEAAELQFSFTRNGKPGRARVRLFRLGGALYLALLVTEQKDWDASLPYFQTFLSTLRKAS